MPFGLCNAPATFQRYMLGIFSDMIECFLEIFMDDFFVFGNSLDNCLINLTPYTFICVYNYFPMIWYVKIKVMFFIQFSYKSLPKFAPKFRQSLPYTGRFQVIDIYPVYTSNISHLITQSRPNHFGSQSHKHHHHHHNHNISNIHWTTNIIIGE
jgi:hypothetical protein